MKSWHLIAAGVFLVGTGILGGIAFQKWISVGRVLHFFRGTPDVPFMARPALPNDDDVWCILGLGQSNVANHGWPRGRAGADVYTLSEDGWSLAVDPLPGSSGTGGSVWTRLGPEILGRGLAEAVVFGVIAQGSSPINYWSDGDGWNLVEQMGRATREERMTVDAIIWHQGETEGWRNSADARDYQDRLQRLVDRLKMEFPQTPIIVCTTTRDANGVIHPGIRRAQQAVANSTAGVYQGPDTDAYGEDFRRDDKVHWNEPGMQRFASDLADVLAVTLQSKNDQQ